MLKESFLNSAGLQTHWFGWKHVSKEQMSRELRKAKVRKSSGPDAISSRLLRDCADQFSEVVQYDWLCEWGVLNIFFRELAILLRHITWLHHLLHSTSCCSSTSFCHITAAHQKERKTSLQKMLSKKTSSANVTATVFEFFKIPNRLHFPWSTARWETSVSTDCI